MSYVTIVAFVLSSVGMFFQWCLCSGIFLVGIVVQIVRSSAFHPLVMVGGAVWSTGDSILALTLPFASLMKIVSEIE